MATPNVVNLKKLTEPFPPNKVKQKIGQGRRPMNYISHGLVTERLNDADPNWSSEIITEHTYKDGQGRIHCEGVTLALTVNGVTRVEAGGPQRQDGFTNEIKNAYSDALKRAAMRFGVALEMWESLLDAEGDEDYDESHAADLQPARQAAQPLQRQAPQNAALRPAQAPQNGNGDRPQGQMSWDEFWRWARSEGLHTPRLIEERIGQSITGLDPVSIQVAILGNQMTTQTPQNAPVRRDPVQVMQNGSAASDKQLGFMVRLARDAGWQDGELDFWIQDQYGVRRNELDKRTASQVIELLQSGEVSRPESEQGMFPGMPDPSEPDEADGYVN